MRKSVKKLIFLKLMRTVSICCKLLKTVGFLAVRLELDKLRLKNRNKVVSSRSVRGHLIDLVASFPNLWHSRLKNFGPSHSLNKNVRNTIGEKKCFLIIKIIYQD